MKTVTNTVVLVGHTCSGKTTLAKALEKEGYERIVTYTTRPKRTNEIDGVDYHFISEDEFKKRIEDGFFAEFTHYNANFGECYYGSAKEDYLDSNKNKVIVLNPRGIMNLTVPCNICFIYVSKDTLLGRAKARGDDIGEVERRYSSDKEDIIKLFTYLPTSIHASWLLPSIEGAVDRLAESIDKTIKVSHN